MENPVTIFKAKISGQVAQCMKAILIFLIVGLFACVNTSSYAQNKKVYYIGYSSNLFRGFNINDARVAASLIETALIKEGSKFYRNEAVTIDDPTDIIKLTSSKELDFVSLTSLEFISVKDKTKLYPYVAPVVKNNVLNKLLLLVRIDSNIKSINDLKNKLISTSAEYNENFKLPTMWIKLLFWDRKIKDVNKFIGGLKVRDNPSVIANDVFFKTTDACIIYESEFETLKELNPQLARNLTALASSEPYITDIGCYTANCKNDPELERIKETTYNLHTSSNGKNLLKLLKVRQLLPYQDDYLININHSYQRFILLMKNGYK